MEEKELTEMLELLRAQGREPHVCDTKVPVMQTCAVCGTPTPLGDEGVTGYLPVPLQKDVTAVVVRVRGDSMIEAGLVDGDNVVVLIDGQADDGDIVAALLDNECTIKVLAHDENGVPWLIPRNESMQPICVSQGHELRVIGRVQHVLRQPTRTPFAKLMKAINQARQREQKRGRPQAIEMADITSAEHLGQLHRMIDGRRGKHVAQVIQYAFELGWFDSAPTYQAMAKEFGNIGARSGFYDYMDLRMTDAERSQIVRLFNEG